MVASNTEFRNADAKGRVTLGDRFANRTVLLEERGDELIIRLARVIPESEAWLYENKQALAMVRRGLKQADARQFAAPPDLAAAKRIATRQPRSSQTVE